MARKSVCVILSLTAAAGLLSGCAKPWETTHQTDLREQLISSHRAYLQAAKPRTDVAITRPDGDVAMRLTEERREELDQLSGPNAYANDQLALGPDLMGASDVQYVEMSLQRAIQLAAERNLVVQQARLVPAIADAQLTQAEAVFDASLFMSLEYSTLDTPRPPSTFSVFGAQQAKQSTLTTGIRKPLTTGGRITASTSFGREFQDPTTSVVKAYETADVLVSLEQPLLRNFGTDVNRSQILLATNERRRSVVELKNQMLDVVATTEQAYWSLALARQNLLIRQRLLERTIEDRDRAWLRRDHDASPVKLTEANSFVELRRADVIRARAQLRNASDQLKQLIHWEHLPVSSEALIMPVDQPINQALQFSLLDSISTALRHRPEVHDALLGIDDASIRQRVADNQRLPILNLTGTLRYNGIGSNFEEAYDDVAGGDFIDYLLGAQFEYPIGNRSAEAAYRQRMIERQAAVYNYKAAAQTVVLEVKQALRQLITAYELIGANRAARLAATDNLRAIEAREHAGEALTPEFLLDLKLSTQQRLADAELQEFQALTDYNTAIAAYYRTLGTLLEHNGIEFVDPVSGE